MIEQYQCGVQLVLGTPSDLHLNTMEDIWSIDHEIVWVSRVSWVA